MKKSNVIAITLGVVLVLVIVSSSWLTPTYFCGPQPSGCNYRYEEDLLPWLVGEILLVGLAAFIWNEKPKNRKVVILIIGIALALAYFLLFSPVHP